MAFPTPVGGTPLPSDLAPSVLFAVLYLLLTPLLVYRVYDRRSRTILLMGTITFAIERVVVFSLRAVQSQDANRRLSSGLGAYMQASFAVGYIGIVNDLVNLLRCLIVNQTYGSQTYAQSPAATTKGTFIPEPPDNTPDHPHQRFLARRFADFGNMACLASIVLGAIAYSQFSKTFTDPTEAQKTYVYRYASSAVALALTFGLLCVVTWACLKRDRVSKRGLIVIFMLSILTGVISVYRLAVMSNTTPALAATGYGTLNGSGDKLCFYIFHVLPEWLATVLLLGDNVRKTFGTGMFGDYRYRDETPQEKARRENRLAKRAEEKRKQVNLRTV